MHSIFTFTKYVLHFRNALPCANGIGYRYRVNEWTALPASGAHTQPSTGQSRHRINTFVHLIQSFRDAQTISSPMNMFRYFCNVSLFSAVHCALCAPIETRTNRADRVRKEKKKRCIEFKLCLAFLLFFAVIGFRSSVSNHNEIDRAALNISCAPCSAFTENRLDDRLYPSLSQSVDRLSRARARCTSTLQLF